MKILLILLAILLWTLLVVKSAGSEGNTETYSEQFVEARNIPLIETYNPCSCVSYYKFLAGIPQSQSLGDAKNIFPWYLEPKDSGMVITYEGGGHIAYYTRKGDTLYLQEANFERCKISTRELRVGDPIIRGYR